MKKWWHRQVDYEILGDDDFDNLDRIFNEDEVIWKPIEPLKRSDPQIKAAYNRGYQAGRRKRDKK